MNLKADKEIEVTPEMVEAGCAVLLDSGRLTTDYLVSSDPLLVQEIFLAMLTVHLFQPRQTVVELDNRGPI